MSEENKLQVFEILNQSLGTEISIESFSEIAAESEKFISENQERYISLMNCCGQYIKMRRITTDFVSPSSFCYGLILGTARERNKHEIRSFVSTFERIWVKK